MSTSRKNFFKVLILTDSRGRGLQEVIEAKASASASNIVAKVTVKPGATLDQCIDIALSIGSDSAEQFDIVVIQAGICDFTQRRRQGRIKILNYVRQGQVEKIEKSLDKLDQALGNRAYVATLIIPASLKKYLNFHQQGTHIPEDILEEINEQQPLLIKDIEHVNSKIFELHKKHGNRLIDLHDRVFSSTLKRRKNKNKVKRSHIFKDNQLFDGVHPEIKTAAPLVRKN
jgi:lysophospholipase L1-like esterase